MHSCALLSTPEWKRVEVCMCVYILKVKAVFHVKLVLHTKLKPCGVFFLVVLCCEKLQ